MGGMSLNTAGKQENKEGQENIFHVFFTYEHVRSMVWLTVASWNLKPCCYPVKVPGQAWLPGGFSSACICAPASGKRNIACKPFNYPFSKIWFKFLGSFPKL
jgi:hypothetical protein